MEPIKQFHVQFSIYRAELNVYTEEYNLEIHCAWPDLTPPVATEANTMSQQKWNGIWISQTLPRSVCEAMYQSITGNVLVNDAFPVLEGLSWKI